MLNPPIKRRIVNTYPALGHHFFKVPVANPVFAIPPDAEQDDLGRKPAALEHGNRGDGSKAAQPGSTEPDGRRTDI
jgi:hypothetical protein